MQKKCLKVVGCIVLFVLALVYIYYYRPLVDDELYGYGFGINILNGLIPYRDFNMIITPLFSYIVAFFLWVFGEYLIVYHIIISLIVVGITVISYKKIGWKAIVVYLTLLIYPYTGYNMFSILLLFILLSLDESSKKYLVLEVLLISMMILTKQVLGLLVIPNLIYSKNRRKNFLIYLGIGLIFILSLVFNNSLVNFIDYCFLGMFDFSSDNSKGFNFLLVVEIGIIIYLTYEFIKKKDKKVFYILLFQIMCFPIVNYYHFMISFVPVLYYLLGLNNNYLSFMISVFMVTFFIVYSAGEMVRDDNYLYHSNSKYENFYEGRMVGNYLYSSVDSIDKIIEKYEWDRYYLLGNFAYIVKLSNGDEINKFDLINNGNMGYDGSSKYISEIDDYCSSNKCLFIIESRSEESTNQTNMDILEYVEANYIQDIGGNVFKVYVN